MKTRDFLSKRIIARGFTLMELMVVITIIAILASLTFAGGRAAITAARKKQAEKDALGLKNAIATYYTEYRRYPVKKGGSSGDDTEMTTDEELMDPLMAATGNDLNPRGITFFSGKAARGGRAGVILDGGGGGRLVDPWGHEYGVIIDTGYDNKVEPPFGTAGGADLVADSVIVWSNGPDEEQDTSDDIRTW